MEIIRAEQTWQQAAAYYVRIEAMVKGFQILLNQEFDQHDTPETKYVVAVEDGVPSGTCRLHIVDENTAKIERVCVLESSRGTGVGRAVIQAAEEWLKELGIRRIIITSRDEAVGFYEKLGYTADWSKKEDAKIFTIVYTEKILL